VYDGGGVNPDFVTSTLTYSSIAQILSAKYLLFDYATQYKIKHPSITDAKSFHLTDAEYADFISWLSNKEYDYETESEAKLEALKEKAEKENYFQNIQAEYNAVKSKIKGDKSSDLKLHEEEIKWLLENEIVSRYYYQNGRTENSFSSDPEIKMAIKALTTPNVFTAVFNRTYKE
jgi:carboxyl-terminal processing protease